MNCRLINMWQQDGGNVSLRKACGVMGNVKKYTEGKADNIDKAIEGLDQFTKNWCTNVQETKRMNRPVYRCSCCPFPEGDTGCSILKFAFEHESNYDMSKFGV